MQKQFSFQSHGMKLPQVNHLLSLDPTNPISSSYLKAISRGFQFTTDVVEQRCIHALPYHEKYMVQAYRDFCDEKHVKSKRSTKRLKRTNRIVKHPDCLTKEIPPLYQPLPNVDNVPPKKFVKSSSTQSPVSVDAPLAPIKEEVLYSHRSDRGTSSAVLPPITPRTSKKKMPKNEWDEYVLSLLSINMARYITFELNKEDESSERLEKLVIDWYGEPPGVIDLIPDEPAEYQIHSSEETPPSIDKLLKEPTESVGSVPPTDPYAEDNQASFYRLPINMRRERTLVRENAEALNKTATSIQVERRVMTPPKTMRHFLHSGVGDKFYDTDNLYERELLTGGKSVFVPLQKYGEKITMELSHNEYVKLLQPIVPPTVDQAADVDKFALTKRYRAQPIEEKDSAKIHRQFQGMRRWIDKPDPVKESMSVGGIDTTAKKKEQFERDEKDIQFLLERQTTDPREKSSMITIMEEWRQKWFLSQKFADSTVEELICDMKDVNPITRIQAIVTCAKAASYTPPPSEEVKLVSVKKSPEEVHKDEPVLPPILLDAMETLTKDSHPNVRQAAAISLYTLGRRPPEAEKILRQLLASVNGNDNWASAQCLIHAGASDEDVIRVVLNHLMTSEESVLHQRAFHLLAMASGKTKLVHAMVAEHMNSSGWRQRIIACKLVPVLQGSINKDLLHKLSDLLWCDWHPEVRNAAAQAMGRTGHGKTVHEDLRTRLLTGNEGIRANAVQKLGFLGIMTTRLMPIFLHCFDDPYVSVRQEACIAAARLKINNDNTLEKLVHLVAEEPIWRVKAHAIKALGIIGVINDTIKETLIWAFRYENEPAVRAEAIHSLVALKGLDPNVALIMRDRFFIEDSQMVKSELDHALRMLDLDPNEDIEMMLRIREEVKRLNTKPKIFSKIMDNEKSQHYRDLHDALIPKRRERVAVEPTDCCEPPQLISHSAEKITDWSGEDLFHEKEAHHNMTETMFVINESVEPADSDELQSSSAVSHARPLSRRDQDSLLSTSSAVSARLLSGVSSEHGEQISRESSQLSRGFEDKEDSFMSSGEVEEAPGSEENREDPQEPEGKPEEEEEAMTSTEWDYIKPQTDEERNVKSSNSKSRMSRTGSSVRWNEEALQRNVDDQPAASPSAVSTKSTFSSSNWSEVTFPRKLQELIERASELQTQVYRLPSSSSHIRPVPLEKTGSWMSLHSMNSSRFSVADDSYIDNRVSTPLDISVMPISPHVRKRLEEVDNIEGLDLGPLLSA